MVHVFNSDLTNVQVTCQVLTIIILRVMTMCKFRFGRRLVYYPIVWSVRSRGEDRFHIQRRLCIFVHASMHGSPVA